MATITKVPAITSANIASDEKARQAVRAETEAKALNETTGGASAMFLYARVHFLEGETPSTVAETFGGSKGSISKAGKVIRHYLAERLPDPDHVVTVDDVRAMADAITEEWPSVFAAYRELWPTVRTEKTLHSELARLFRKAQKDGMTAEEFGLHAMGVAEEIESAGGDDDGDQ
jgi:hypothetical protein